MIQITPQDSSIKATWITLACKSKHKKFQGYFHFNNQNLHIKATKWMTIYNLESKPQSNLW